VIAADCINSAIDATLLPATIDQFLKPGSKSRVLIAITHRDDATESYAAIFREQMLSLGFKIRDKNTDSTTDVFGDGQPVKVHVTIYGRESDSSSSEPESSSSDDQEY
jgi:hypothetical protein